MSFIVTYNEWDGFPWDEFAWDGDVIDETWTENANGSSIWTEVTEPTTTWS